MAISNRQSVIYSLWASLACTMFIIVVAVIFHEGAGTYLRFGPNSDLTLLGIRIDSWTKWFMCLLMICFVKGTQTIVGELGSTVLGFSVYNPTQKVITDFSKNELQFFANAMFTLGGIQSVLMSVINVTQIDLAFCGMLFSEIVSLFTIRALLNGKTFQNTKVKKINREAETTILADENC